MKAIRQWIYRIKRAISGGPPPRVAVLRLEGVIEAGSGRVRHPINMASLKDAIDAAFDWPDLKAVALQVNSPGGAPVQSGMVADYIRKKAREDDIPVLAFAEDVAASGGYILALAGSEIYAHEASIIGSIGVISGGFGFVAAMEKLGVERRVYTAGDKKVMLDPFQPEKEDDIERIREIQAHMHEWFKGVVRDRRGKRLKSPRARIFSGEVFIGSEAHKMGLIDGIGSLDVIMKDRFGDKTEFKLFTPRGKGLAGLLGLAESRIGIGDAVLGRLEERGYWSRFGL